MLENIYDHDGVITTMKRHCDLLGLSTNVAVWRASRGLSVHEIFAPVPNPIKWDGEIWTVRMLAERACLPEAVIRDRARKGLDGAEMVAPSKAELPPEQLKLELVKRNREFLRRLLKHHRRRAIEALKGQTRDVFEDPTDTAAAMLNAQRFVAAARDNLTASTGAIWETAA